MEDLLTEWGLPDLIGVFLDNAIDMEALRLLAETDIQTLIPKVGLRLKFLARWKKHFQPSEMIPVEMAAGMFDFKVDPAEFELQSELSSSSDLLGPSEQRSTYYAPSESDDSTSPPLSQMSQSFLKMRDSAPPLKRQKTVLFDAKKILGESAEGRGVITSIEKAGFMTKSVRHRLVKILVSNLISHHGTNPGAFEKSALAESVVTAFPCLKDPQGITGYEALYTKGAHKCPAGGYLEEHLRYVRKHMMQKKKAEKSWDTASTSTTSPEKPDEMTDDVETTGKINWLKDNLEPASQVKEYMAATAPYRRQFIKNEDKSVAEILKEFPRLLDKHMIEQDFKLMHPTIADNLYLKWGAMVDPLIQYGTQTFPLWKEALGLPADFDPQHLTKDQKMNLAFFVLPIIFSGGKRSTGGRYGPKDSMASFIDTQLDIIHMPTYCETIDETKRPQPYVLILHSQSMLDPTDVFVIIAKQALPQHSLMQAIDVCYKAHYALDCKYQAQCSAVWTFFERCIYNQPGMLKQENPALRSIRAFLAFKSVP